MRLVCINLSSLTFHSYRRLEREKSDLEQEFAAFRREVRSSTGNSSVQDIRALRTLVRNLEEQLTKEKNQHQRLASKRSQEYRDLLDEVLAIWLFDLCVFSLGDIL